MFELKAVDAAPLSTLSASAATQPVLRGVNLALADGEVAAVIGPSGAGKTTLLHLLACAQQPVSGSYQLQGLQPWTLSRRELQALRGSLFLAPQVPPLPPRQRVVTAVLAARLPAWSLARSLRSLFYPSDIPAAHLALAHFDLADKLFERVDRLSGGERQRVGLARALLAPARLWLLDEPLSALDPQRAAQAAQTLVAQACARGVSLLASLHPGDMALAWFPRIIGLRQGQIMFDLAAADVTPAMLDQLYASSQGQPAGIHSFAQDPSPLAPPPGTQPAPVLMQCR